MSLSTLPEDFDTLDSAQERLSYKFQRLREQLREAIATGEFTGRLPGERDLGRRFNANAKTINKALSDLSAEGLVVRRIGRGTFVNTAAGPAVPTKARAFWWISPKEAAGTPVALPTGLFDAASRRLGSAGSRDTLAPITIEDLGWRHESIRKRSMRETDGVIIFDSRIDDTIMAELIRRHVPTVVVGGNLDAPRVDSVQPDDADAGFRLTEHLYQIGMGRVVLVSTHGDDAAADRVYTGYHAACRRRRLPVEPRRSPAEAIAMIRTDNPLGIIAVGVEATRATIAALGKNFRQRNDASLTAVLNAGVDFAESADITAYEVPMDRMADWSVKLLREWKPGQPPMQVVIPGRLVVRGSTAGRASRDEFYAMPTDAVI